MDIPVPYGVVNLLGNEVNNSDQSSEPSIWTPESIHGCESAPAELKAIVSWLYSYVVKPHSELGRSGLVCPFVPLSIKANCLWIASAQHCLSQRTACSLLQKCIDVYNSLPIHAEGSRELKSLILVFPQSLSGAAIELIHCEMKPSFVNHGLMLGEFFPESASPGIHNPKFNPLRSPLPLFVIRQMVPNDFVFLNKPTDTPDERRVYLGAYLKAMRGKLTPERLREVKGALAADSFEGPNPG